MFNVFYGLAAITSLAFANQAPAPRENMPRPVARVIATLDVGEMPTWFQQRQPEGADLQKHALQHGFDFEVVNGRAYLLDQRLYDLQAKKRHHAALEELRAALGSSGVFSVENHPELSRLVRASFGPPSMNYEGVGDANYSVLPSLALALSDGSKAVTVYLQPTPSPETVRSLQQRPLRPSSNQIPTVVAEKEIGVGYTALRGLKFEVRGRDALSRDQRARDLHVITRLIVAKEEEWAAKLRDRQTILFDILTKFYPEFEKVENFNGSADRLPEHLRTQMTTTILEDFKGYGFTSEAAASEFLSRANARATPFLALAAASRMGPGFGMVFYSLPIP